MAGKFGVWWEGDYPYGIWRVTEIVGDNGMWITHPEGFGTKEHARMTAQRWADKENTDAVD